MKKVIGLSLFVLLVFVTLASFLKAPQIQSIPPKNVKDILSNSQYSYFALLSAGNTATDTTVKIDTSYGPAKTSNNLFIGDTVSIGSGGTMNNYYVKDIGLTNSFFINTGLLAANLGGTPVAIATRSAIHTVTFEPQISATGGHWKFLLKATNTTGENNRDGIPDQGGFDLGNLVAANVSCPWGASASVGTTTMLAVGSTSSTAQPFHVVDCALGGGITNPAGTGVTGTISIGTQVSGFINPSPTHSGTLEGNADIFTYVLRHTDSSDNLIDQAVGRLAVVESVRITATVDPTISFYIDNIGVTNTGAGGTACTVALSAGAPNTTGDMVSFGSLALNAFNQLAQRLSCVTNGLSGYVVTAYEGGPMKNVNTGTTIADTNCDGACTTTSAAAWTTDKSNSEFGYSVENIAGTQASFLYTTGYKPFGNGVANAQPIMSRSNTPPSTESVRVCYRVTASTVQEAGDYEAKITYTATATF